MSSMPSNQPKDNALNADHALDSILSADLQRRLPGDVRHILELALSAQQEVFAQEKAEMAAAIQSVL